MFRHDHVSDHDETIFLADAFQDFKEEVVAFRRTQKRLPPVATAGDRVQVSATIESLKSPTSGKATPGIKQQSVTNEHQKPHFSQKTREMGHPIVVSVEPSQPGESICCRGAKINSLPS